MKKGISLIVLVITIIIIIILAGAVILNLSNNNPIDNANTATLLSEQSDFNSAMSLYLANQVSIYLENAKITGTELEGTQVVAGGDDTATLGAGYYDLSTAVIKCGENSVTGYDEICNAVGMTPSKAGAGETYQIAVNGAGVVKFYKAK